MAKSKRNKVVNLTKTKKTNLNDKKVQLVDKVHELMQEYQYIYSFTYKNMFTMAMQELRNYWNESKFLVGKNKVLQVALGRNEDESHNENSYKLSKYLRGNCGLFFSNEEPEKIIEYCFLLLF